MFGNVLGVRLPFFSCFYSTQCFSYWCDKCSITFFDPTSFWSLCLRRFLIVNVPCWLVDSCSDPFIAETGTLFKHNCPKMYLPIVNQHQCPRKGKGEGGSQLCSFRVLKFQLTLLSSLNRLFTTELHLLAAYKNMKYSYTIFNFYI